MATEMLAQAIALSKAGEKRKAREILVRVIADDPRNEAAWLWYAHDLPTAAERVRALEECLHHNPDSAEAQKRLSTFKKQQASAKEG